MRSRFLYRFVIVALMVATLTCNLVMVTFLHRFFYGDVKVPEPETLHRVASSLGSNGHLAFKDFQEIVAETDAFATLAATMVSRGLSVYVGDEAQWLDVAWSSGTFAAISGRGDLVGGRLWTEADDSPGSPKVAVVSEAMWSQLQPGRSFEPGAQVYVKGNAFEVVGVVRNAFPRLDSMDGVEVWIPARQNPDAWQYEGDDYQEYQVLARLDPERRTVAELQLDVALEDIDRRLGFLYTADILSETEYRVKRNPGMHRLFLALLVVSGFLFVLGVVNQLLMLVTRSVTVASDLKIMISLGAQARHVLTRFARGFLALLGVALLGVGVCSVALLQLYNSMWGAEFGGVPLARLLEPMSLALLLGLVALLLALHLGFPALLYVFQGRDLAVRDRAAGSRFSVKGKLSVAGVALQIGIVTFTILGSGAFLQSLSREGVARAGPWDDRIVSVELALASKEVEYGPKLRARLEGIRAGLMELGGVEAMGTSNALPLHQGGWTRALIEGEPVEVEPEWIAFNFVTPGYFETYGLKFLEGRDFLPDEAVGWPHRHYVVNQAFVERYFPDRQVTGRNIAPWEGVGFGPIVGVAENISMGLDGRTMPCIYIPFYQNRFILHVRLSDRSLVASGLEAIVDRIKASDPEVIVVNVDTIDTVWEEALSAPRLGFYILVALSGVGLALSLSGAFGYQSYMMALREREFAIRQSLGQSSRALYWSEVRRGLWMAGSGLGLGVLAFFGGRRLFWSLFFNIDLSVLGAVLVVLGLAGAFLAVVAVASLASMRPRLEILMRE